MQRLHSTYIVINESIYKYTYKYFLLTIYNTVQNPTNKYRITQPRKWCNLNIKTT